MTLVEQITDIIQMHQYEGIPEDDVFFWFFAVF
jgi:hypothetical protein